MSQPNPYESPRYDARGERDANEAAAQQPPAGEQITWLHAGLWALAMAFVVFLSGFGYPPGNDWRRAIVIGAAWLVRMFAAASLAAILLAAVRRRQQLPTFPAQFGHWLLLMLGTNWIAAKVCDFIPRQAVKAELSRQLDAREIFSDPLAAVPWMQLAVSLAALIVPWLAYRYSRGEKWWPRFALLYILLQAWQALVVLQGGFTHWTMLPITTLLSGLAGGSFLLAAYLDLTSTRRRDQLHWLGLGLFTFDYFLQRILAFGMQLLVTNGY